MPLIKYTASNVRGLNNKDILIDEDFLPCAETINAAALKHGLLVIVISSKREDENITGAIVEPAKKSNHYIGMAWDFNLVVITTKEYWNSKKLATPTGKVKDFIEEVEGKGIRWGGRFKKVDVVHLDNGINVFNPELYQKKYAEYFQHSV